MKEDLDAKPLSLAALHILLALAGEDRHGYGIMQDIADQSGGKYRLGPGTLYDNLKKLMESGLVDEVAVKGDDPRRRVYTLTRFGSRVLTEEMDCLDQVIRRARRQLKAAAATR